MYAPVLTTARSTVASLCRCVPAARPLQLLTALRDSGAGEVLPVKKMSWLMPTVLSVPLCSYTACPRHAMLLMSAAPNA